jgi:hypothetical protein
MIRTHGPRELSALSKTKRPLKTIETMIDSAVN